MNPLASLPYEWLGVLTLGVLVVNTSLIVFVAWKRRHFLGEVRRRWAKREQATVQHGLGPGGILAQRRISQLGRALTVRGPDRIVFTDASTESECFGGAISRGASGALTLEATRDVELWLAEATPERDHSFDDAWARASTNKGFATLVDIDIEPGTQVWVCHEQGTLCIATFDPLEYCDRMRRVLALFCVGSVLCLVLVTALACSPPVFGPLSTLGAALGVAFFLAIQPLGVAVRDYTLLPPMREVGGTWARPVKAASSAPEHAIF